MAPAAMAPAPRAAAEAGWRLAPAAFEVEELFEELAAWAVKTSAEATINLVNCIMMFL